MYLPLTGAVSCHSLRHFLNGEGLVRKLSFILPYWWSYNAWACLELTTVLLWNIDAPEQPARISWLVDAPTQHCCFFGGSFSATTALLNRSRCHLGKLGLLAFRPDPSPTILWLCGTEHDRMCNEAGSTGGKRPMGKVTFWKSHGPEADDCLLIFEKGRRKCYRLHQCIGPN